MQVDVPLQVELGGESFSTRLARKNATIRIDRVPFPWLALLRKTGLEFDKAQIR